ncbi:hypothetical protein ACUTQ5_08540 [Serratia sp. NA_112.1]|uniref:hypothetical protein n=1 Tax=unclassified Serratia (in: enterobacteria) TaxID=2647522 RepID=UPI004046CC52
MIGSVNAMIKSKITFIFLLVTLSLHGSALAITNAQVSLNIAAESIPRLAIYYQGKPVTGFGIDLELPVNGYSQHFEQTTDLLYIVGNIENANVLFSDVGFVLNSISGGAEKVNLQGDFIYQGSPSNALEKLRIPVLNNIGEASVSKGFKVRFKSDSLAGNYPQGSYANSFTLLVTPIL